MFNLLNIMSKKELFLLPKIERILTETGENIKLARLRRKLSSEQVSERAGIARTTLWSIEKGSGKVALGAYAQVLFSLGMEQDLLKLAGNDELGRKLQDAKILVRDRASKTIKKK